MKIIDDAKVKKANKESDRDLEIAKKLKDIDYITVRRDSKGVIALLEIHHKVIKKSKKEVSK
jgi:hypothetical protein